MKRSGARSRSGRARFGRNTRRFTGIWSCRRCSFWRGRKLQMPVKRRVYLELPEVFFLERPDPLDGGRVNGAAFVDAFVGNPPFAGKNAITEAAGPGYLDWLMVVRPEVRGRPNTDLAAYFFRRAADLLGVHGTVGFVSTSAIAQGDTRLMSLKHL